jgi:hypothetical protein
MSMALPVQPPYMRRRFKIIVGKDVYYRKADDADTAVRLVMSSLLYNYHGTPPPDMLSSIEKFLDACTVHESPYF